MSKTFSIASIPGDGIGVDITEAAEQVLNTLAKAHGGFSFKFTTFDWSCEKYLERKYFMPEDGMDQLKKHDAIYFGAVGWPSVPDHVSKVLMFCSVALAFKSSVEGRLRGAVVICLSQEQ